MFATTVNITIIVFLKALISKNLSTKKSKNIFLIMLYIEATNICILSKYKTLPNPVTKYAAHQLLKNLFKLKIFIFQTKFK